MNQYYSAQAREFNKSLRQFHSNLETLKTNLQAATEKSDKRKFRRLIEKETEMMKNFKESTDEARTPLYLASEIREDIINDLINKFIDHYREVQDKMVEDIKKNPESAIRWHTEDLILAQEEARLSDILINHTLREAFEIETVMLVILNFIEDLTDEVLTRATYDLNNSTNPLANAVEQITFQAKAKFVNKIRNLFSYSYAKHLMEKHQIVDQLPEGYEAD